MQARKRGDGDARADAHRQRDRLAKGRERQLKARLNPDTDSEQPKASGDAGGPAGCVAASSSKRSRCALRATHSLPADDT